MRKKRDLKKYNTKFAVFFVIFVCLIILASFILKLVQIIGQSKFDGNSRFTISVSDNKNLKILSFSPNTSSMSVLNIDGELKGLNVISFLAIPIDGVVQADFLDISKDASDLMSTVFLNFRNIKTNLTIVDTFRLLLISKTIPSKYVKTSDISTSLKADSVDKTIGSMLNDEKIVKEDVAIEIINATPVIGLGAKLARFVENMGGKVVQVSSEIVSRKTSMLLYNGDKTYTIERLHKAIGFKLTRSNRQSIGDITIIIGEDSKDFGLF